MKNLILINLIFFQNLTLDENNDEMKHLDIARKISDRKLQINLDDD